jgi:carbon starvation protein CstA
MIVLAATVGTSLAALIACHNLARIVYPQHIHDPYGMNQSAWMIAQLENRLTVAVALAIAAIVCSRLHRWLLQRPLASDRTIA